MARFQTNRIDVPRFLLENRRVSDSSSASSPAHSSHLPGWQVAVGFCVVCAALLRGWAAQGDLWLDEIWSINKARQCPSIWFIVTGRRLDFAFDISARIGQNLNR